MGEGGMGEAVHGHFGSAPFFYLYNTEDDSIEQISNSHAHHEHGMCNPLGSLEEKGAEAVLTAGIGGRALQILNSQGITVYRLQGKLVRDAVEKIKEGGLEKMTPEHSCQGHGCH